MTQRQWKFLGTVTAGRNGLLQAIYAIDGYDGDADIDTERELFAQVQARVADQLPAEGDEATFEKVQTLRWHGREWVISFGLGLHLSPVAGMIRQ